MDSAITIELQTTSPRTGDIQYSADVIENWARTTQPSQVARSGRAFDDFSRGLAESLNLLHRTAQDLAEVWSGEPSAGAAQQQLQQLYQSTQAISEASKAIGDALQHYGEIDLPRFQRYFNSPQWVQIKESARQINKTNPGLPGFILLQDIGGGADQTAAEKLSEHNKTIATAYDAIPKWYSVTLPTRKDNKSGRDHRPLNTPPGSPRTTSPSLNPPSGHGDPRLPSSYSMSSPTPSHGAGPMTHADGTQLANFSGPHSDAAAPQPSDNNQGLGNGHLTGGGGGASVGIPRGTPFVPGSSGIGSVRSMTTDSVPGGNRLPADPTRTGRGMDSAASTRTGNTSPPSRGGAAPIGMMPGVAGGERPHERRRDAWMTDEEDIWQPADIQAVPPLIGELPGVDGSTSTHDKGSDDDDLDC